MNATKPELTALIDWVQVTFKNASALESIEKVLMLNRGYMTHENRGRFRYAGRWTFGGIEVLTAPADYPEMGTHLYMTGSACRAFEIYLRAQGRTWFDFFRACLQHGSHFTRLDLAVDDRMPYFAIAELDQKGKTGECISRFRKRKYFEASTIKGERTGRTLSVGARESKCSMIFYEKNYEQSEKTGKAVEEYGAWNRYEIRLRQEVATQCVRELVKRQDIREVGIELMNTYIRLLDTKPTDSNRARWQTWEPWAEFMEGMGKLKLTMQACTTYAGG